MKRKNKRIVYISQEYPYPPNGGGTIKTLNTLVTLASHYKVYAVFLCSREPSAEALKFLKRKGIQSSIVIESKIADSVKKHITAMIFEYLHLKPHYHYQYKSREMKRVVGGVIDKIKPTVIHIDHLNISQYLPNKKNDGQTWILEHHNIETHVYLTRLQHARTIGQFVFLLIETIVTYMYESMSLRRFDHIFCISQRDCRRAASWFGINNVSMQSVVYSAPMRRSRKNPRSPSIVFVGNTRWPPNEDALVWYFQSIHPQIIKKNPHVLFHLVGHPNTRVLRTAARSDSNYYIHGFQKSTKLFLESSAASILPIRSGGGVRLKALEAMSSGVPIVGTRRSMEGIAVSGGHEYLNAETPIEFANAIHRLITSSKTADEIAFLARVHIDKYYSPRENRHFLRQYKEIIHSH